MFHHSWSFKGELLYAFFPPSLIHFIAGLSSPPELIDDSNQTTVAEGPMVFRDDQIVSQTAAQVDRSPGHDLGPDNRLLIARLPQVIHDGILVLAHSPTRTEGSHLNWPVSAWKSSTNQGQSAAIWRHWTAWCGRDDVNATAYSGKNITELFCGIDIQNDACHSVLSVLADLWGGYPLFTSTPQETKAYLGRSYSFKMCRKLGKTCQWFTFVDHWPGLLATDSR